eukprot:2899226-Rhodomonas_salina.1
MGAAGSRGSAWSYPAAAILEESQVNPAIFLPPPSAMSGSEDACFASRPFRQRRVSDRCGLP